MSKVKRVHLRPWIRDRDYLFPVAGVAMAIYCILAFPVLAMLEHKEELKEALTECKDLAMGKVY